MNEQIAVNSEASNSQQTQENIWDSVPVVDDVELPFEEDQVVASADDAGEQADEQSEENTDQTSNEIDIDGEKITKDEIKELVELKQAYTQQRQADSERVRNVEATAYQAVAQVQEMTVKQIQMIKESVRQLIAPGVTPEYLMQLASQDPASAQQLQARLNALDMWQRHIDGVAGNIWQQAQQAQQVGQQQMSQQQAAVLQAESQKLSGKQWFTPEFQSQAVAYCTKHGIPESEAKTIHRSGAIEILRKAMLYDKAVSSQKNKQVQSSSVTPGSRAANGQVANKQSFKQLEQRALKGDRSARAAYVKALIPTI